MEFTFVGIETAIPLSLKDWRDGKRSLAAEACHGLSQDLLHLGYRSGIGLIKKVGTVRTRYQDVGSLHAY